jgi:prohibitin 1
LQDAERSKFVVMKAEQEKQAAIIRAEGESQAAELISNALKESGNAMIEVKRIDAAREIAEVMAQSRNVVYLPSGNGAPMMTMPMPRAIANAPVQME